MHACMHPGCNPPHVSRRLFGLPDLRDRLSRPEAEAEAEAAAVAEAAAEAAAVAGATAAAPGRSGAEDDLFHSVDLQQAGALLTMSSTALNYGPAYYGASTDYGSTDYGPT